MLLRVMSGFRVSEPRPTPKMILGLAGVKGSGKDTFAAQLEGWRHLAFATAMKQSRSALFNVPMDLWEQHKNNPHALVTVTIDGEVIVQHTFRAIDQRNGTEAHREQPIFGDSVWVDWVMKQAAESLRPVVITDARFPNEQRAIKAAGGFIVRIDRPGLAATDEHQSEKVEHGLTDFVVTNDSSVYALRMKAMDVVHAVGVIR